MTNFSDPLKSTVRNFTDADELTIKASAPHKYPYDHNTFIPALVTLVARDGSCSFQFGMSPTAARYMAHELLILATAAEHLEQDNEVPA